MSAPQGQAKSTEQDVVSGSGVVAGKFVPSDKVFLGFIAAVLACAMIGVAELWLFWAISAVQNMSSSVPDGPLSLSDDSIWGYLRYQVGVLFILTAIAFGAGGAVALTVCGFVGIPVHLLLVWRRVLSLKAYLLAGVFADAAVSMGVLMVPGVRSPFLELHWLTIPDFVVCGPLAGGVFWWVVRPDRRLQGSSP